MCGHEEIPAIGHKNKEHHSKVDATCMAAGTIEYWSCPDCGKNFSDEACTTEATDLTIAIDSNNHVNKTEHVQQDANCLEKGYTAGTYCEDCDKWISGHEEIPAIGHKNKEHHEKVDATCVAEGTIEYWSCPDCEKNFSDEACTTEVTDLTIAIDPNNHDLKTTEAKAPTCTEIGWDEYVTCQREGCGHTTYVEIPATGNHTYTDEFDADCNVCGTPRDDAAIAIAQIGTTQYKSLLEAITAAKNGDTVVLLADAEGPGLEIDKYVTINFGGHTYTITDPIGYDIDGKKTDDDSQRVNGVQIKSDVTDATKKVELKNGKLEISEENAKNFYVLIRNYENLTITDMVLDGTELDTPAGDKKAYVLLNNAGKVEIAKSEQATAEMKLLTNETDSNAVALSVCTHEDHPNKLIDVTVKAADLIRGKVEVTESSYAKLTIAGGTYTVDVTTYCVNGNHTVSDGNGKYVYGAHSHNAVVTAPTCENEGYTTYTCACGNSYVGNKVAAKGHTFTNGECHCGAMCGDLNDDDKLSIADIVLLNAYVKGITQLKDAQIYVCDVNGDEVITELDVTALQAIILGKQAVTTP